MDNLKPCPFCGGQVTISLHGSRSDGYWLCINRGIDKKTRCTCRLFMESDKFAWDDQKRRQEEADKLANLWNNAKSLHDGD